MWTKLIDLILQWWKEKSRKDLIRQLVYLRNSMRDCQEWYDKLQAAKRAGNVDQLPYPNPRVEWIRSVGHLGSVIQEVDQVLSIFSPEARQALENYFQYESLEANAESAIATTAAALGTDVTDVDIAHDKLGPSFKAALDTLDSFIRSTFKAEEIHTATSLRSA